MSNDRYKPTKEPLMAVLTFLSVVALVLKQTATAFKLFKFFKKQAMAMHNQ